MWRENKYFATGLVLSAVVISEITYRLYKHLSKSKFKQLQFLQKFLRIFCRQRTETILTFPDEQPACVQYFRAGKSCTALKCSYAHSQNSFGTLIKHLSHAVSSVDICVFCFTSPELANIVRSLHEEGVRIRIITDWEQSGAFGQVRDLSKNGIPVRHGSKSFYMHHKFSIIDSRLLLNGSFNWTRRSVTGNHENLHITDSCHLISKLQAEFNRLWKLYEQNTF